jgi:hypothetical protein
VSAAVWVGVVQSLITATAGLLGVLSGGWITRRQQHWERKNARIREQLQDFYSPLLAMRAEIRAKSELRVKVSSAAHGAWTGLFEGRTDPEFKRQIDQENAPQFEKIIDYNNTQLREVILPLYRKMLAHFGEKMWLAEPSTVAHYGALSEYVEIWNRAEALPGKVIEALGQDEKKLYPFYDDLKTHFERLSKELKK